MNQFVEEYRKDKKVRDLIKHRNHRAVNIKGHGWDFHELDFKITHIRCDEYSNNLNVNIKVCGRMHSWGWRRDKDGMSNIMIKRDFRSAISRNNDIRNHTREVVRNYLKLFGVSPWRVIIKKVTVVDSL